MKLPILYKYTSKGQVQQWQIFVNGDQFFTEEGIKGGKLTTSLPTVCKPKNVGRSNATTADEQAMTEAKAKHQKKLDKGYNTILTTEKKFFEPMLAHEYDPEKIDWDNDVVWAQPKLDGLRNINQDNTQMSRNGKPYLACPHLNQDELLLDGELYNHLFKNDFNKIVSLCKKQKPTVEELKESKEKVEYWIYDFPGAQTFSKRYKALQKWFENQSNPAFKLVPTRRVKSQEELDAFHAENMEQGFEGTIVRLDGYNYENKRSKSLLKYKKFVDEEFKIVGAAEGEGGRTGTIGYFVLELGDGSGKTFHSNVKGNFEYLKEVWRDHKKYFGKKATVKYFNRTPDNVPRFPYIIKLDRESYE